jgi:hypothetical protein
MRRVKVFEGVYTEDKMEEDLMDDIYIVFSELPDTFGEPMGTRPGKFRVVIYEEN